MSTVLLSGVAPAARRAAGGRLLLAALNRGFVLASGLAAVLPLGVAQSAAAITYDLNIRVYCDEGPSPCGFASEAMLRAAIYDKMEDVNRQWLPHGISFRPASIDVTIGGKFVNLSDAEGKSDSDEFLNEDLREELQTTFGATSPQAVTMFLVPGLAKCWSARPWRTNPGDPRRFGVFCGPGSPASTWAHELGHHFCLTHTFTKQDTRTHEASVNWDGDSFDPNGPFAVWSIEDTPDDPEKFERTGSKYGPDENEFRLERPLHEWCEPVQLEGIQPVDLGSYRMTYCAPLCWRTDADANVVPAPEFRPLTENSMSYYGNTCKGPYVVAGIAHEAYTPQQIDLVGLCRSAISERVQLVDVCANDGDRDADGWCDSEDSCPDAPNTGGQAADADMDGLADACDPCPFDPNDNQDTDGDGLGDNCGDLDDDNDGCSDPLDQNPLLAFLPSGVQVIAPGCPNEGAPPLVYEGKDSDGDFLLNCLDPDDDNDGVLDVDDSCPFRPGEVCADLVSCPLQRWWDACLIGGCDEIFASFESLIDPRSRLIFDRVLIDEQTLYLAPNRGSTLSQQALSLVPALVIEIPEQNLAAAEPMESPAPTHRVALYSKATQERLAVVAEYHPLTVDMGEIRAGDLIAVTPDALTGRLGIRAAWSVASDTLLALADLDGDTVPDPYDNCVDVANLDQRDSNDDGFGNLCDADLDDDGTVDAADLEQVRDCKGYLASYDHPGFVRGDDDQLEEPDERTLEERQADQATEDFHARRWNCEHADFDGSGRVTGGDLAVALHLAAPGVQRDKVDVCHKRRTISIGLAALAAHVEHGDATGTCP